MLNEFKLYIVSCLFIRKTFCLALASVSTHNQCLYIYVECYIHYNAFDNMFSNNTYNIGTARYSYRNLLVEYIYHLRML